MEKYKSIYEEITNATAGKVILKKQISWVSVILIVIACIISVWGFSLNDPDSSFAIALQTVAIILFIIGIVKLLTGKAFFFHPTGAKVNKQVIYFAPEISSTLQLDIENKRFDDISNMEKREDSGVKADMLYSKDRKFAAVQISEYVPYEYEAVTPVLCFYDADAGRLIEGMGV